MDTSDLAPVEKGKFPQLEESYIRDGLEVARNQIARSNVSTASIDDIVAKVQRRHAVSP